MTLLNETPHDGNFILSEDNEGRLSRDNIVIASGAGTLLPGTLLGKLTASGKFAPSPETAADGSETTVAILVGGVDATSSDVAAVGLMRHAEVNRMASSTTPVSMTTSRNPPSRISCAQSESSFADFKTRAPAISKPQD